MSSNQKKFETLGMPHGTANSKLRRNIIFSMACRLGEDSCYKCGEKIKSPEELSIEHKLPWEGVSSELFWDLDNIAFSHRVCNRPHGPRGLSRQIDAVGRVLCPSCSEFKELSEFSKNPNTRLGINSHCKPCKNSRDSRASHDKKND